MLEHGEQHDHVKGSRREFGQCLLYRTLYERERSRRQSLGTYRYVDTATGAKPRRQIPKQASLITAAYVKDRRMVVAIEQTEHGPARKPHAESIDK